ncbi:MAG TPA: response regulator transcription factor [Fodinibius sp.]|nr:response regulator transcription factor [Fodinibius sp.]
MASISVLIAEDHEIVRYGISSYLSSAEDITIAGETSTGDECIELYKQTQPDICLLDISMPGKSGIEAAKEIRSINPDAKILILSMHIDQAKLKELLNVGIDGYLVKDIEKDELLRSIRAVVKGQRVFSKPISDMMTRSFLSRTGSDQPSPGKKLTKREKEIITLIAKGLTSNEIADKLYISPRTVDTHRSNLMEKLELKNIAELVRYAIKHDLISSE